MRSDYLTFAVLVDNVDGLGLVVAGGEGVPLGVVLGHLDRDKVRVGLLAEDAAEREDRVVALLQGALHLTVAGMEKRAELGFAVSE